MKVRSRKDLRGRKRKEPDSTNQMRTVPSCKLIETRRKSPAPEERQKPVSPERVKPPASFARMGRLLLLAVYMLAAAHIPPHDGQ